MLWYLIDPDLDLHIFRQVAKDFTYSEARNLWHNQAIKKFRSLITAQKVLQVKILDQSPIVVKPDELIIH